MIYDASSNYSFRAFEKCSHVCIRTRTTGFHESNYDNNKSRLIKAHEYSKEPSKRLARWVDKFVLKDGVLYRKVKEGIMASYSTSNFVEILCTRLINRQSYSYDDGRSCCRV